MFYQKPQMKHEVTNKKKAIDGGNNKAGLNNPGKSELQLGFFQFGLDL
jgi:hypothetical protein